MKPFLGIDITTNKKNEESHGKEFLTATPSAALSTFLETNSENAEKAIKKYRERYVVTGIFENAPYDGIVDLLKEMKKYDYYKDK